MKENQELPDVHGCGDCPICSMGDAVAEAIKYAVSKTGRLPDHPVDMPIKVEIDGVEHMFIQSLRVATPADIAEVELRKFLFESGELGTSPEANN